VSAFEETIARIADDMLIDAYIQSAATYDAQGKLRRAIDAYKTALQVQPGRVEIYFHLATLYDDYYRDKTTAAHYYRKFLAVADSLETPFHAYASSRLEKLRPTLHFQEGRVN
jgi:tetratricopeptide (TPR) repeat protein